MFYEVLSYESVSRDVDNLKALIASDNFDAGFGLGQTEIQLLQCIHDATKLIHPPRGMTQWDVVRAVVLRTSGQRWSEEELASLYNFPKVVSDVHLRFLSDMVSPHVEFDVLAVRPQDFHLASRLHTKLPLSLIHI